MTSRFLSKGGSAPIGYRDGAGGTVTQATSKSTGVTINKLCGQITMNNAALLAAAEVIFTVTNNLVRSTDVPLVVLASGAANPEDYTITVVAVANGSFSVMVGNVGSDSESEALVLNFAIIRAVAG